MTEKIFLSKAPSVQGPLSLFREALGLLFPSAVFIEDTQKDFPHSFFLRDGENIFWAHCIFISFSKNEISGYLEKAKQVQSGISPEKLTALLFAPDFEAGVREILEFLRIPIRFFRYQEGVPLERAGRSSQEPILWLQEMATPNVSPSPLLEKNFPEKTSIEAPLLSSNRLSREELREFIQLELDAAQIT